MIDEINRGFSVDLYRRFEEVIIKAGWERKDLKRLIENESLCRRVLQVIRENIPPMIVRVVRSVAFNAAIFVGPSWKVLTSESDNRLQELCEIDFSRIRFRTCLRPEDDGVIMGEEKLKRLREKGSKVPLDSAAFLALWREEKQKTLEWFYKELGVDYVDFFGTILANQAGVRCVLYLYRSDKSRWEFGCRPLNLPWNANCLSICLPLPKSDKIGLSFER